MGRLIIVTGPSCIGKSPLDKAMQLFYPEMRNDMQQLVLWNSRDPRPGEVDGKQYHFRPVDQINELKSDPDFVVMEVRGDTQALDVEDLGEKLKVGDVFYEGNTFMAKALIELEPIRKFAKTSIFISPLTKEEIMYLREELNADGLESLVTDIMRRKLLRRTKKQKGILSMKDLENIQLRAKSAYKEMKVAHIFDFILPNHDGEDAENWNAFYYPVGDARKTLQAVKEILAENKSDLAEKWGADLLG